MLEVDGRRTCCSCDSGRFMRMNTTQQQHVQEPMDVPHASMAAWNAKRS